MMKCRAGIGAAGTLAACGADAAGCVLPPHSLLACYVVLNHLIASLFSGAPPSRREQ
jgi:hypothetical protein